MTQVKGPKPHAISGVMRSVGLFKLPGAKVPGNGLSGSDECPPDMLVPRFRASPWMVSQNTWSRSLKSQAALSIAVLDRHLSLMPDLNDITIDQRSHMRQSVLGFVPSNPIHRDDGFDVLDRGRISVRQEESKSSDRSHLVAFSASCLSWLTFSTGVKIDVQLSRCGGNVKGQIGSYSRTTLLRDQLFSIDIVLWNRCERSREGSTPYIGVSRDA